MRKRVSVVIRLFVMLAMALGLATLMSSPATAQTTQTGQCQITTPGEEPFQGSCTLEIDGEGQCQVITDDATFQNAQGCGVDSCPRQIIAGTTIIQFQCDAGATETPVTPGATETPVTPGVTETPVTPGATETPVTPGATETPVTPGATETPVTPGATETPVTPVVTEAPDEDDDDGGQAEEEEMPVNVLPETGQGSASGQSNSANILLLGAMGAVLTLGAVALRLRNNS